MGKLVPEQRSDKNGRMVTRWVRPDSKGRSAAKGISHVSSPTKDRADAARGRRISRIATHILKTFFVANPDDRNMVEGDLKDISDEVLKLTESALKKDPELANPIYSILCDFGSKPLAKQLIYFASDISLNADESIREGLVVGLKEYKVFKWVDDLTKADAHTKETASALLKVGYSILSSVPGQEPFSDYGINSWHIDDEKLVDLIVANPEKAEEIASFIEARRDYSGEAVAEFLSGVSALREGTL